MATETVRFMTFGGGLIICEYDWNTANGRVSPARIINNSTYPLEVTIRNNGVIFKTVTAPAGQISEYPIAGMTIGMEEPDPEFPDETLGIDLGTYSISTRWPA